MTENIFSTLETINEIVWAHAAFVLIVLLGGYFTLRSRFFQVRKFVAIIRSFAGYFGEKTGGSGVHPLKAFFAAIGGCIGIGNVVGICTAVQLGGPGALFWTWVGGLLGMLIQYAEVYLGLKYRVPNEKGSYDGGPMYFLPKAYKTKWVAPAVCFLLCIYGVEIFMFNVMTSSIATNWNFDQVWVVLILLAATIIVALGGIKRVGEVCGAILPTFLALYLVMAGWVLYQNAGALPTVFSLIFKGAFTTQAAVGGFAGSTVMVALSMGLSRGAYSGDVGVGYTSIIYAESSSRQLGRQASMTIIGIFLDTFMICSLSLLIVLSTGIWNSGVDATHMVQTALAQYFPYMHLFMPFFLFLLGYTTILAYFVVGVKCARFLSRKWGPLLYYLYASISLPLFAFVDPTQAFVIMSLSGACLLILNLFGIFLLRKEVEFHLD